MVLLIDSIVKYSNKGNKERVSMSKHYGQCALCGAECDLSFEHIPPQAAFNRSPAKPVSGDDVIFDDERMPWEMEGLPYINLQRGMGMYSLCQSCNNNTGSWYAEEYILMAHAVHQFISNPIEPDVNAIGIKEMHPARFIKQVLSMFCSINGFDSPKLAPIRKFVSNKKDIGLDKSKYKLCMYFTKSNLMKYNPFSVVLKMGEHKSEMMALSEIVAYPLGFVLYFDPDDAWQYEGFDISSLADYAYDDIATVEMPLQIKEMNDILPTYYRSKEEVKQCIEENQRWRLENGV